MRNLPTDKEIESALAANLKRLRGKRTISRIADVVGVQKIQLSRWERGENVPGIGQIARLAALYGTSIDAMISAPTLHEKVR